MYESNIMKCEEKIKNEKGIVTHYILSDMLGHKIKIESKALKYYTSKGSYKLTNLTLTSDNKLVDSVPEKQQAYDKIKAYRDKETLLGINESAFEFKVVQNDDIFDIELTLIDGKKLKDPKKVVIPSFVTKLNKSIFESNRDIEEIVIKQPLKDMSYLFKNFRGRRLDLSGVNMTEVEDITEMFNNCMLLEELIVPEGCSKLEKAKNTFYNCSKLINLDLSNWDFSNISNATNFIKSCKGLRKVQMPRNFNENGKLNQMLNYVDLSIISDCSDIRVIDLGNANLKYMSEALLNGFITLAPCVNTIILNGIENTELPMKLDRRSSALKICSNDEKDVVYLTNLESVIRKLIALTDIQSKKVAKKEVEVLIIDNHTLNLFYVVTKYTDENNMLNIESDYMSFVDFFDYIETEDVKLIGINEKALRNDIRHIGYKILSYTKETEPYIIELKSKPGETITLKNKLELVKLQKKLYKENKLGLE